MSPVQVRVWASNSRVTDQQHEGAISYYKEVIKSDPTCTDAYMNIGICYDLLRDYSKAIDFYDMAYRDALECFTMTLEID